MKVNRQILKKIEEEGKCWNGELTSGKIGKIWADVSRELFYELESEDEYLSSIHLSDEDIDGITVVGWLEV